MSEINQESIFSLYVSKNPSLILIFGGKNVESTNAPKFNV